MTLADQIIEHGPFEPGAPPDIDLRLALMSGDDLNALRDELIEGRRLRAAAETQSRFELEIDGWADPSELDLSHDCPRWSVSFTRALTLAELNQRAAEHAEECR